MERKTLDLLGLHVAASIVEVKDDVALVDLLHEEVLATVRRDLVEARKLLELAVSRNVEPRRVLALRRSETLGHVLGSLVKAIEHERLCTSLGRRQVVRHSFGGTRRGDMLDLVSGRATGQSAS